MNSSSETITPEELKEKARKKLDNLEKAERSAGKDAVIQILEEHMNLLMDVRRDYPLEENEGKELLSSNIVRAKDVPKKVRQELEKLHSKVKMLIETVASDIEERKYKSCQEAILKIGLSPGELKTVDKLVKADQALNLSCQQLKIATEYFAEVNRYIIGEIDKAEKIEDKALERNLVIANAVMVYEMTDYVVKYLESFQLYGKDEILELQRETSQKIERFRQMNQELKARAEEPDIQEEFKKATLSRIEERGKSIQKIEEEWQRYLGKIEEQENSINSLTKILPSLKLHRTDAEQQLYLLEIMTIVNILTNSLSVINTTIKTLEGMELVSIGPERIGRLLGIA